jgi:hypothetical protein
MPAASGSLADTLFNELKSDANFTLPSVDLTGPSYAFPDPSNSDLYAEIPRLTEGHLTQRKVGGTGMFDALMASVGAHLKGEFEKNRITGKDYTDAYVALTQAALGNAVQYLLASESAYWQARMVQEQAKAAEIQVVGERVNLAIAKVKLASAQQEAYTLSANYALTKMKLATEDAQFRGIEAQVAQTSYQTASLMPAQLTQLQKEIERATYELSFLLPKELEKSNKGIEVLTSQISQTTAQKDQVLYQTSAILPAQKVGIEAETNLKNYQLGSLLPAQVANTTVDTATKTYNKDFILPEQKKLLQEQMEAQRAQTKDTRSDGGTINGTVGKQKDLYEQQITSYKRDAETKVAKMLVDGWTVQRSTDEGVGPPTQLADPQINSLITKLRANLSL